jgi:hypothetical protein
MNIKPVGENHIIMTLDSGAVLDINDGTAAPKGKLSVALERQFRIKKINENVKVYLGADSHDSFACQIVIYEVPK